MTDIDTFHTTTARSRTRIVSGLVLASLVLILAMAVPAMARHAEVAGEVAASGFAFQPDTLTIPAGTNLQFSNADPAPHTLSGTAGMFDSGVVGQGGTRVVATDHLRPGTYPFLCRVHPENMTGTLIVDE